MQDLDVKVVAIYYRHPVKGEGPRIEAEASGLTLAEISWMVGRLQESLDDALDDVTVSVTRDGELLLEDTPSDTDDEEED